MSFKVNMQPSKGRPPLRGSVDLVLALKGSVPPKPAESKALPKPPLPDIAKAS